jgi:hypothetical protein
MAITDRQRELAARALCRRAGDPEDAKFYGKPMWMNYLGEVDAVLNAIEWPPAPPVERTGKQPFSIREAIRNTATACWRKIGRP